MRRRELRPRTLLAALSLLFCLSVYSEPSDAASVAKGASKDAKDQTAIGAITDLKEARARLAKAAGITAGGADYRALLSAFSSSLEPSDALLLLSESIPALPQAERYPFLVESGDLSLLLGLFADAASRYAEASSLAKGGKDERLLLRSARCSLAAGDPERASAVSADVLIGSPEPFLADEARLVSAWALVAQGRTADARAVAASVAAPATGGSSHDDARLADRDDRCEARFILWLIAGDSAGKAAIASSLASDFPGSPEALIATGAATAPPLPHWYLGGLGADISSGAASSREASGDSKPAKRVGEGESPAGQSAALIEKTAVAAGKAAPGKRLQLGYFSVGENAEALKDELASKGFAAAVEERLRPDKSGGEVKRWIVTVESGADLAKTIQKLKDAGYEAYTIE